MVFNAEGPLHDFSHTSTRPQIGVEAGSLRPVDQDLAKSSALLVIELRRPARVRLEQQTIIAYALERLLPALDARLADARDLRDITDRHLLAQQFDRETTHDQLSDALFLLMHRST